MITPDLKNEDESADSKSTAGQETGPDTGSESDGAAKDPGPPQPTEIGGRAGPDPTRYGDWEKAGRCIDF